MFSEFWEKLKYKLLLSRIKPEILGYKNFSGNTIAETRVSNMSHLSNKKNLTIGKNVFIGHFNYIDGFMPVKIGDGVQITNYISILTHSSHHAIRLYGEHYSEQHGLEMAGLIQGEVIIGDYSFIGPHSVIMPGTIIGKGCIISAYSFVSGIFEDCSIIKGNPATVAGDTKTWDDKFYEKHPDLKKFYFANDNNLG